MKTQSTTRTPSGSAPTPSTRWIATVAAVLLTTVSLAAINTRTPIVTVDQINGSKVINLAPVNVHPSASEMRAAAMLTDVDLSGTASLSVAESSALGDAGQRVDLISSQLTMPYYSFGTQFGNASKE